jgi:hypothetical protein
VSYENERLGAYVKKLTQKVVSLNYLATPFTCSWPWSTMVLLCDGRLVCAGADPYGKRPLGDTRTDSVSAIWTRGNRGQSSPGHRRGRLEVLRRLPAQTAAEEGRAAAAAVARRRPICRRASISNAPAACNISCNQACCAPETGITRTRQAGMLDYDLFTRVVDEAGPSLGRSTSSTTARRSSTSARSTWSSTSSRAIRTSISTPAPTASRSPRTARAGLARSGIDEVTFSIDGATAESYVKYRQRGDFAKAIRNLTALCDEKRKNGRRTCRS